MKAGLERFEKTIFLLLTVAAVFSFSRMLFQAPSPGSSSHANRLPAATPSTPQNTTELFVECSGDQEVFETSQAAIRIHLPPCEIVSGSKLIATLQGLETVTFSDPDSGHFFTELLTLKDGDNEVALSLLAKSDINKSSSAAYPLRKITIRKIRN